ncbi:MAG: dTDP-4-dehydrorhamnose 3,5-epimerase family protein, partial [Lentisphaeria bacterium]|nr:dTDP-4-dehydrorhamnose 3,5-epimerase family protein [Lentisphaeria bacterium]
MNIIETALSGVLIIEPKVFGDARGYFFESWNQAAYEAAGITNKWVQDNESKSCYGVLRGLQSGETILTVSSADGRHSDSVRVEVSPAVRRYRALLVSEENYPFSGDARRNGSENSVMAL